MDRRPCQAGLRSSERAPRRSARRGRRSMPKSITTGWFVCSKPIEARAGIQSIHPAGREVRGERIEEGFFLFQPLLDFPVLDGFYQDGDMLRVDPRGNAVAEVEDVPRPVAEAGQHAPGFTGNDFRRRQ